MTDQTTGDKIAKSDAEWRAQLTPEQYRVARRGGTEPPFTGRHLDQKGQGDYLCACCGQVLFESSAKFDSGTGWPSFWSAAVGSVAEKEDRKLFVRRTEVVCNRCDAHLGHVFPDGPAPTGLRYCINSAALEFRADE